MCASSSLDLRICLWDCPEECLFELLRKKPHLQGRFSGRLETKEDEKKLHDECRLLGPLVGGVGKRGEKSRTTLAKIVRAISAGDVRKHCEERESRNQVGRAWSVGKIGKCKASCVN